MGTLAITSVGESYEIAEEMKNVIEKYFLDTVKYRNLSISEFFNMVKYIPYVVEFGNYQLLQRPSAILNGNNAFVACANKAIAMASFLKLKGIPYKIKMVSDRDDLVFCHVFCIGFLDKWVSFDCTYPENTINMEHSWTNEEEI